MPTQVGIHWNRTVLFPFDIDTDLRRYDNVMFPAFAGDFFNYSLSGKIIAK